MIKKCKRCGKEKNMMSWETMCYECMKLKVLEETQAAIREVESDEGVDTWSDDYVICPYCGEALETDAGYPDFLEIYEDGDHELECPECGETFILNTMVSYSWETKKRTVRAMDRLTIKSPDKDADEYIVPALTNGKYTCTC